MHFENCYNNHANLAQLVEQWFCKPSVRGSSPRVGSRTIDMGRYRSGQPGQTVNLLAYAFVGSNPSRPTRRTFFMRERFFYCINEAINRGRLSRLKGRDPVQAKHWRDKSAGVCLRGFESLPAHKKNVLHERTFLFFRNSSTVDKLIKSAMFHLSNPVGIVPFTVLRSGERSRYSLTPNKLEAHDGRCDWNHSVVGDFLRRESGYGGSSTHRD